MSEWLHTDVLVVGAGAAGLCAALHAKPRRVLIVTPELNNSSCTELAQGGIAAPVAAGDSVALHVADTLRAAAHSGCAGISQRIINAACEAIRFLESAGVRFDRHDGDHSPDLHLEGGHAVARILHADGDATGAAIHAALLEHARAASHITLLPEIHATSLLTGSEGVAGVCALRSDGAPLIIRAGETVLATGGLGRLFSHTTNGPHATGAGLAMALQAGAAVAALEFVQFHPTALRCKRDPLPLLTEALRGAGAVLLNDGAERFMLRVDARAELAPRDIVAREVWQQQQRGRTVFLDARRIFTDRLDAFPAALAACRGLDLDPAQQLIPVTCAAHFHMGGVRTDAEGRSSLPGLWACGEVACTGFHGANRLASNSLLEAVVMGSAVGQALAHQPHHPRTPILNLLVSEQADLRNTASSATGHALPELMWHSLGPVRSAADLCRALQQIGLMKQTRSAKTWPLRARLLLCEAMLGAALRREESRGAHWRSDFPRRNHHLDGWPGLLATPVRTTATGIDS